MKLSDLDINKIEQEIFALDLEISKIKPLEDRKKELQKLIDTVEWYIGVRNTQKSGCRTDQGQDFLDIMEAYPEIAIKEGREGVQRMVAIHKDNPGSVHKYAQERLALNKTGWVAQIKASAQKFLKPKVKQAVKDKNTARNEDVHEEEEAYV